MLLNAATNRGGGQTGSATGKRVRFNNVQGYNQTQWHRKRTHGRRMSFKKLRNKHIRNDLKKHVQLIQLCNPGLGDAGKNKCNVKITLTAGNEKTQYFNCNFYDLTAMTGNSNTGDCAYNVQFVNGTPDRLEFPPFQIDNGDGGSAPTPQIVESHF
jgi:hypothetical protein